MYRNHKANSCYYHEPFTSCICETFLLGHIKIYKNHVGSGPQSPVSSDMNIYIYIYLYFYQYIYIYLYIYITNGMEPTGRPGASSLGIPERRPLPDVVVSQRNFVGW